MPADPLLLKAGLWLGVATGLLLLATVVGFVAGWGTRFRLVGVTSFTGLLAISCLAFAISYSPRTQVAGAVSVPVVFDNGTDLVIAAAPGRWRDPAALDPSSSPGRRPPVELTPHRPRPGRIGPENGPILGGSTWPSSPYPSPSPFRPTLPANLACC